jgi:protein-disulfide isomerase
MRENLLVPISIVIAGTLIAGAFFISRSNDNKAAENNSNIHGQVEEISIEPISNSDHILGNPNADIVIVEYSDLECPFCKNYHQTLGRIIDDYGKDGKVAWVYRHFPLTQLHSKAQIEAEATECAGELGGNDVWWDYTNKIFEVTPSNNELDLDLLPEIALEVGLDKAEFQECLDSGRHRTKVQANYDDAIASGGTGTPHTVFIVKGQEPASLSGLIPYNQLKGLLDQTLLGI